MGESTKKDTPKKSGIKDWAYGMKAEFKKVIWPDKNTLAKQTAAVVFVSVFVGAVIALVDIVAKYGIDLLVK